GASDVLFSRETRLIRCRLCWRRGSARVFATHKIWPASSSSCSKVWLQTSSWIPTKPNADPMSEPQSWRACAWHQLSSSANDAAIRDGSRHHVPEAYFLWPVAGRKISLLNVL